MRLKMFAALGGWFKNRVYKKMAIKIKSLQAELYCWIIASTLLFMLISGLVSGAIAFYQARELQDYTLNEIALLVKNGELTTKDNIDSLFSKLQDIDNHFGKESDFEDASVMILEINKEQLKQIPLDLSWSKINKLQTIDFMDTEWRVLIVDQLQSQKRILIAQSTELRDEIAFSSAQTSLYPILIFAVCLLLLVHFILRKQFKSIKKLTNTLDQQDGAHVNSLSEKNIPSEIQPFIHSINNLMQRVNISMERQQRFIADAAHELRTPIAALSLQVENVESANNPNEREERLSYLQQGIHRLGKLVGQLLDLARLQSNSEDTQIHIKETVSLNNIVKQVIQDLFPIAEKYHVDLGVIRQDDELIVNDIHGHLSQLIQNAVANAIHYTPEAGEVNISLLKNHRSAVLLIEDTGIGIPEEELEKVMQPFYRILNNGQTGNGLGLTISQEIADKLGGKITLANREGGGLIYRYEQPLA